MAHPGVMVPFVGMLPGGLAPGKRISIHGMVLVSCNRFSINLQCGPNVNPRDDISLHLNFRYDQQVPYVVRNSLQMQQWGLEEGHGYLSFSRGHTFEIMIHVEHDHYKVYFNGQHFTDFRYRIPYNRVSYVTIDGEVVIHAVKIDGYDLHSASMMPSSAPPPYGYPGAVPMAPTGPYAYPSRVGPGVHPTPGHMMPGPTMSHVYPGYPMSGGGHPPSAAIPVAGAAMMSGMAGAAMMHGMDKKSKKAMKKAMKHHKHGKHSHHGMHGYGGHYGHHGHHKKSSSSSSSSEEEE